MVQSGKPERVVEMRHEFQELMGHMFKDAIEELSGSQVVAFLSQAHVDPDITIEIFLVEPALDGFGAAELIEPERIDGS